MESGYRSGRLVAKEPIGGGKFWLCNCDCGNQTTASKWHLEKQRRQSCGCRLKAKQNEHTCTVCNITKPTDQFYHRPTGHIYQTICQECHKKAVSLNAIQRRRQARINTIQHYSNGSNTCSCCGEALLELLTIDHINGGGNKHKKEFKINSLSRWLQRNNYPDGYRVLCMNCNTSFGNYGYCPHHQIAPEATLKANQIRYRQYRLDALKHYGGQTPKCECCSVDHLEFLQLDHINGDGADHRRQMKTYSIYLWLRTHQYPDLQLRILCSSCNHSIGAYGYCPHNRQADR